MLYVGLVRSSAKVKLLLLWISCKVLSCTFWKTFSLSKYLRFRCGSSISKDSNWKVLWNLNSGPIFIFSETRLATSEKERFFLFAYLQSVTKYYGTTPFFHKKFAYNTPIPPSQCWESVKIVLNCSDGCLVHLGGLKRKKSTLKLGEGGLFHSFCGWLSESQNLFWQGFTLADAFKHFKINSQLSFILFILPLQVPTKLAPKKTACSRP